MTYGVTDEGISIPTLDDVKSDIETKQRALIDPELDVSEDSPDGQNNGIFAAALSEAWEALERDHNDLDPATVATDAAADRIARLTGIYRLPASYSTVSMSLNLDAGKTVTKGKLFWPGSDPSKRFQTDADAVNPSGSAAWVTVSATALITGPVFCSDGTITQYTDEAGLLAAYNPEDTVPGRDRESTPDMMRRREDEIAKQGSGTIPATKSEVAAIEGVLEVSVYENNSDVTNADGMPPHTIEVVVSGGDGDDIAAALWAEHGGGIGFHGNTYADIEDSEGLTQRVEFTVPTEITAYARVQVANYDAKLWPNALALKTAIKEAIAAAVATYGSGSYLTAGATMFAAYVADLAMGVDGVVAAVANVSTVYPAVFDLLLTNGSVVATNRERVALPTANIVVDLL